MPSSTGWSTHCIHSHSSICTRLIHHGKNIYLSLFTYRSCRSPSSIPLAVKSDAVIENCIIRSVFHKLPAQPTRVSHICAIWSKPAQECHIPVIISTIVGRSRRIETESFRKGVASVPCFCKELNIYNAEIPQVFCQSNLGPPTNHFYNTQ